ncbi:hypothetical protein DFJ74DRAFT_678915 [Hyaloraphidium curvatum]|nr:hypothetical protein DFJ74DRAFT_678915 [Hyaloraphidium curvatum]
MAEAKLNDFNARWLKAWTDKDVEHLLSFYDENATYRDPQTADGIKGHEALRAYLTKLFGGQGPCEYRPQALWVTDDGYCGRWYATLELPENKKVYLRGFDQCVMNAAGDKITHNEVYVHPLSALPAEAK